MAFTRSSKLRTIILGLSLLMIFASFISLAQAQSTVTLTIREGTNERFFKITEGHPQLTLTFHVEQKSNEISVSAKVYATDLWDQARARVISADESIAIKIDEGSDGGTEFTLGANSFRRIALTIDTSKVGPGTYSGKIVVFGVNIADVEIPLKIQVSASQLWLAGTMLLGIFLGYFASLLGVIVLTPSANVSGKTTGPWQMFRKKLKEQGVFVKRYILPAVAALVLIIILFLFSFQTYYSRVTDFGAEGIDYIAALLFGLGQYGAGKATATLGKKVQD